MQVGVFWDRFGYIEPYDTYMFGRTHQGGARSCTTLPGGGRVQTGIGIHQAQLQQNQGMTPIAHVAAAYPVGPVELGAYALRTWTRDKRQLSPIQDGTMYVAGLDAKLQAAATTAAPRTSRSATTTWTTCSTSRPRSRSCTRPAAAA